MYTNVSRVHNRENDDFEKCLAVIYTNGPRRIPKVRGKRQERFAVLQSVKTSDIRSIMQQQPKNSSLLKMHQIAIKGESMYQTFQANGSVVHTHKSSQKYFVKYFIKLLSRGLQRKLCVNIIFMTAGNITQDNPSEQGICWVSHCKDSEWHSNTARKC